MATLYLDVDDEITSVAARIRSSTDRRVAVVLPHGSRVATSRINFRLLARDALSHEKRLSIVAADPATRALAASAGLPVFASVGEYDAAMGPTGGGGSADAESGTDAATAPKRRSNRKAAPADEGGGEGDQATAAVTGAGLAASATVVTAAGVANPDVAGAGASVATAKPGPQAASVTPGTRPPMATPMGSGGAAAVPVSRTIPVERSASPRLGRTPILIGAGVLGLAALVGGVGAYLLLPSANVVLSPRQETVGPLRLTVTASTTASEPDAEAGIVPAEQVSVEVSADRTFEATGKRVEEEKATGTVQFSNRDFTAPETVPKGSVVSTSSGVRFRTNSAVRVPEAELVGLQVFPATANVKVTAVEGGEDGNVEPNTIVIVPRGEDPETLTVRNPDATKGGSREEFPRVSQKDVDAAMEALGEDLDEAFAARLEEPDLTEDGATVFPDTATLGEPAFEPDPESLVGEEQESFELAATATGSVVAVDAAPVRTIAEQRLAASVPEGFRLVDGSSEVTVDPGVVSDGAISFPAVATARQIATLDPAVVEAAIRGRSIEEARTILADFGTADLAVWPDWVTAIPTLDARVDVAIEEPVTVEVPGPSASPDDGAS
jgi:hypothetical protein